MKIEDVELMSDILNNGVKRNGANFADAFGIAKAALTALRAEAWHPIEKAEGA